MLQAVHTEFVGLAAYLETCDTDVILLNLSTTIAGIKRRQKLIDDVIDEILKAKGVQ